MQNLNGLNFIGVEDKESIPNWLYRQHFSLIAAKNAHSNSAFRQSFPPRDQTPGLASGEKAEAVHNGAGWYTPLMQAHVKSTFPLSSLLNQGTKDLL
jgi:hypothetical protein